jgi:hypothetical protein
MGGVVMNEDSPIVKEVRDRATEISERFGHDLHRYAEHLRQREQEHPDRVVNQITVVASPTGPRHAGR